MFDIGGIELLVIAAVAILVVGPKELPALMRGVGRFVAKAQNLAREFRHNFEDMARESELEEVRKDLDKLSSDVTKPFPLDKGAQISGEPEKLTTAEPVVDQPATDKSAKDHDEKTP